MEKCVLYLLGTDFENNILFARFLYLLVKNWQNSIFFASYETHLSRELIFCSFASVFPNFHT